MVTHQKKVASNLHAQRYGKIPLNAYEEYRQDPLFLLQDIVERIIITHDEEMDLATRVRLENMHHRLQTVARQLCKL